MSVYKVDICGVTTSKLPVLKDDEKEELFEKIKKGDKFFVNGEFNPNAARLITAAHDAYFWVDDGNMPHWTVDAEEGGCYGYGEICQQV